MWKKSQPHVPRPRDAKTDKSLGARGSDIAEPKQAEQKLAEAETQRRVEELRAADTELERFNRLAVDRELRMVELKKEVNDTLQRAGLPPKYGTDKE
jgi:hypothetical protein